MADCTASLRPRGATLRHPNGPPLMVGSTSPRMLAITAPHVDMWNEWHDKFANQPENLAPLMAQVDEAARVAGREPADIARTVTVLVQLTGGKGRRSSYTEPTPPHDGTKPDDMAGTLRRYADAGISHVQLVLDPITAESIAECAPILEALDRG